MKRQQQLSRRERQIMDFLYAKQEATVNEIQAGLPDAPTATAIRTLLRILEEKGQVKRRKSGREHIYRPTESRGRAGVKALQHVLSTFYEGSLEAALAAHLTNKADLTDDDLRRLSRLIHEARNKGK